ncbi:Uncharacterised protein [Staphylococcus petrasii]|uniref:Lipoprotein n=1 Tax=Staphylococcus petrasii TaxID=1276936 RepID=A0A380FXN0_9STAP|nr:Uncharacterised protein [Staphylococcus petrasii]
MKKLILSVIMLCTMLLSACSINFGDNENDKDTNQEQSDKKIITNLVLNLITTPTTKHLIMLIQTTLRNKPIDNNLQTTIPILRIKIILTKKIALKSLVKMPFKKPKMFLKQDNTLNLK